MPKDYKKNCPCPHHPFECFGHPTSCACSKENPEIPISPMPEKSDYAEVLRLYRKYHKETGEPLWRVFVRIGRRIEAVKPERCKTCLYTELGYSRLIDKTCPDPWHVTVVGGCACTSIDRSHCREPDCGFANIPGDQNSG